MAIWAKRWPQGMTAVLPALNSSATMGQNSPLDLASSMSCLATKGCKSPLGLDGGGAAMAAVEDSGLIFFFFALSALLILDTCVIALPDTSILAGDPLMA